MSEPAETPAPRPPARLRRIFEFLLLYLATPGAIALFSGGHRWVVLPAIVLGSLFSFALLWFDPGFSRGRLLGADGLRRNLRPVALRTALVLALLLALLCASGHPPAFWLPREKPLVWIGVLVLYPFLSAVPQEVMYRALFFHRYGELFPSPALRIAASGLVFGWAHVLVHNRLAMLLATAAGVLLSITWHRSRSLLLVGLEHSCYGAFVLTAGVGGMFVNGIRLVSAALG